MFLYRDLCASLCLSRTHLRVRACGALNSSAACVAPVSAAPAPALHSRTRTRTRTPTRRSFTSLVPAQTLLTSFESNYEYCQPLVPRTSALLLLLPCCPLSATLVLTRACDRVLRRVPVSLSVSAVRFMLYVYVYVRCASLEAMFIRAALSALSSRSTLSSSTRQDVNSSAQAVERREFSRSLCCGVQLPIVLRARACLNRFRALLECRSLAAALVLCLQRQLRLSERTHNSNQNSTWSTHSLTRVVRRS